VTSGDVRERSTEPPKYDDTVHAARIRDLLGKRVNTLPIAELTTLLEVANFLASGEPLDTLAARLKLGLTD
jgi:hypothetical protein